MERESDDEEVTSAPTVRAPTWDVPPLPPADPPEAAPRAEPSEGHDGDNLRDGQEDDDSALEAAYQQLVEEEEANSRRDRESTFAELTRYFNARSIMKSPEDITQLMDRFGRCCEGDLWGLVERCYGPRENAGAIGRFQEVQLFLRKDHPQIARDPTKVDEIVQSFDCMSSEEMWAELKHRCQGRGERRSCSPHRRSPLA
jgi:hypothetical protein